MSKTKNKPKCKTYANGSKYWYLNGKLHRKDGPAIEWANGYRVWCLNGEYITDDPLVFLLKLHELQVVDS